MRNSKLGHLWPAGAQFCFNCYCHSVQLILRGQSSTDPSSVLLLCKGVIQGDPLSMILYRLALVPLAKTLQAAFPHVVQPWYTDDVAMHGRVSKIAGTMQLLLKLGSE